MGAHKSVESVDKALKTGCSLSGKSDRSAIPTNTGSAPSGSSDDVHLSELVSSLRSLAADSPERQAKIEQLARAYASGAYAVDSQATAGAIIDDAIRPRR